MFAHRIASYCNNTHVEQTLAKLFPAFSHVYIRMNEVCKINCLDSEKSNMPYKSMPNYKNQTASLLGFKHKLFSNCEIKNVVTLLYGMVFCVI